MILLVSAALSLSSAASIDALAFDHQHVVDLIASVRKEAKSDRIRHEKWVVDSQQQLDDLRHVLDAIDRFGRQQDRGTGNLQRLMDALNQATLPPAPHK